MMEQSKMLDINIETITKEKPYMFNLIEELDKEAYLYEGKITDIFQDVSAKNEKIMGVRKENHDYYLNSRYGSRAGINRWLQVYKSDKEYGIAIVISGQCGKNIQMSGCWCMNRINICGEKFC